MIKFPLLILCAGFGKRMLSLTSKKPKPLLEINNQTLLGNTINFFKDIGCNEIYINTHYLHKKIETYLYKNNFSDIPINLIHEPSILGTGGAVQNIFNYTTSKNICVVNSDIFWQIQNKFDLLEFLRDFHNVSHCKISLSNDKNFFGLKKSKGDFSIKNGIVNNWIKGNRIIFYSGFQIVSKNIFKKNKKNFSMNDVWDGLIADQNLKGSFLQSNILHFGDKTSIDNL